MRSTQDCQDYDVVNSSLVGPESLQFTGWLQWIPDRSCQFELFLVDVPYKCYLDWAPLGLPLPV